MREGQLSTTKIRWEIGPCREVTVETKCGAGNPSEGEVKLRNGTTSLGNYHHLELDHRLSAGNTPRCTDPER